MSRHIHGSLARVYEGLVGVSMNLMTETIHDNGFDSVKARGVLFERRYRVVGERVQTLLDLLCGNHGAAV